MPTLDERVAPLLPELVELRHELHRCPEAGFQEVRTAARVAQFLRDAGWEVSTGIAGTGVVGLLRGNLPGPTIALRACLDALRMDEPPGLAYAYENPGIFHGCGHDGNLTMAVGAARVLAGMRDSIAGNVKVILQPSEEETGGAAGMIAAGCLREPDVDAIITLHNWHGLPEGLVAVRPGPVMACSDLFRVIIIGKPGHGAWPHLAVDPVVVAADVISGLQRIVSREIDPMATAAISIPVVRAGNAVNVIPERVILEGTVRAFDPVVRAFVQQRIEGIVAGVTSAARATYELDYRSVMPPVVNDPALAAAAEAWLRDVLPPGQVSREFEPVMGCEEFSLFQLEVPGLFLYIGNDQAGETVVPIHAPGYRFNDAIIASGVKALVAIALRFCAPNQSPPAC